MAEFSDLKSIIGTMDDQLELARKDFVPAEQFADSEAEELVKYILVGIGPLCLAISIDNLAEVGPIPPVTFLPNLPPWLHGIVNLRSEIISVVDFGGFLNISECNEWGGDRFAVLRYKKRKVGLRIDRIVGTVKRADSDKIVVDDTGVGLVAGAIFSSGFQFEGNTYYLLDVQKFLTSPRLLDYNKT